MRPPAEQPQQRPSWPSWPPSDTGRSGPERGAAPRFAAGASTASRATRDGRPILDQLSTEVPAGVERADVLFALATTFRAEAPTESGSVEEAAAEAAGDDARPARILAFRA